MFALGFSNINILQCLRPRYLRYLFITLFYGGVLLFVLPLPFDLSGMGDSRRYVPACTALRVVGARKPPHHNTAVVLVEVCIKCWDFIAWNDLWHDPIGWGMEGGVVRKYGLLYLPNNGRDVGIVKTVKDQYNVSGLGTYPVFLECRPCVPASNHYEVFLIGDAYIVPVTLIRLITFSRM
jgi:hypothetical protein